MKSSRTTLLLGAASLTTLLSTAAMAGDNWSVATSADITTDYRFRGISNSDQNIAAQAGITLTSPQGFYIGTWASTVDFRDNYFFPSRRQTSTELDLYGGYTFDLDPVGVDVGGIYYDYPGSVSGFDYNYWEAYLKLKHDFGPFALSGGVYYSPDFFGVGTDSAWYVNGTISVPITGWLSASGTLGHQDVSGPASFNYTHWDLGLTGTYKDVSLDVRYMDTNTTVQVYPGARDWAGQTVIATLSWATNFDIE